MDSFPYKRNCELKSGMQMPPGMRRCALAVEYNGAGFHGFQIQASAANTVQAALHRALGRVADEPVSVVCAGRTDAGVHATAQVVHFDTLAQRPERAWVHGTNAHLPDSIRIRWAREVPGDFHARFSAQARRYRYLLYCDDVKPALMVDQITWCRYDLDIQAMQAGARHLVGEHDFTSFRATQCQAHSPVRTLQTLSIERRGRLILLEFHANAFLHHMVRNIVGVLIEIGRGAKPPQWAAQVRDARDRRYAGPTAPAFGLYFVGVDYPGGFQLPGLPEGPHFL